MSTPPTIGTVYYGDVEATQEEYRPFFPPTGADDPPLRTQWRLRPRIAEDAIKRIGERLSWRRREPVVIAEREAENEADSRLRMTSLPGAGLTVVTPDLNITPDAVAEALGNAVAAHQKAIEAADDALVDAIAGLMREHDVRVRDWREGAQW